ncbi:transcription termination factor 3, mitochondrial isoform X2 [Dunckerocampus dactyliophorus]|nr:transcription termination factor 3, mitochondrial isoform X2 [Dunckerocampus dactyliophorus]XP_054619780.1 transcription termination factor 3, mitochondrial isoform X2 [Dunckerocampus dactyliophorus]
MASSSLQRCLRHTLVLPLTNCTQVRHCCTVPRRAMKIVHGVECATGTGTKPLSRHVLKQHTHSFSDLSARHKEDSDSLSRSDVSHRSQLIQMKDAGALNESPTSLDLNAASGLYALEEVSDEEAISITLPPPIPALSTSLRDYVDNSEMLGKLVQLGVNLWKLDQRRNVGSMLLRLDFNTDVAPRLFFLKEIGVDDSRLGYIITCNPFILTETVENLQTRVNYLKSKKFTAEAVASMVSRAPYLLNFSVKRLDNRLGFYQQQLSLNASNTRSIVARLPRLLCGSLEPVKENLKVCEIELGFKANEIQHMVLAVPKLLTANKRKLTQIFDFLHNTMKVPHHLITKFPQVLNSKFLRIRERHLFLQYLGKAQYDPAQPNYVSLDRLVSLSDETFCTHVALATWEDFGLFQKTL